MFAGSIAVRPSSMRVDLDVLGRLPGRRGVRLHPAITRMSADARLVAKIDHLLVAMRKSGRCAISILDTGCGDGGVLTAVAARARTAGFVSIDGTGLDISPSCVAKALRSAVSQDPAVGLTFAVRDDRAGLPFDDEEFDVTILAADADRRLVKACERVTCRGGVLVPRC